MASSKAINVTLGAQQSLLDRRLDSGMYNDASDVVRHALRALDREDAALDEILRAKVKASMANKKPSIPAEVVFKRIQARHARKAESYQA